jgi:UDP-N-acetylmuramyl pentapeptide phosphotransferase/UDP-N-acetylglucosamine-1-phosphate transferase
MDQPNKRSLHDKPMPRLGGVGIISGILFTAFMTYRLSGTEPISALLPILCGFTIIISISLLDDIYQAPVLLRLIMHFTGAILVVYGGMTLATLLITGWSLHLSAAVVTSFSILFIVWMTNLYNFMDGMDGLAAGMGIIGFGTFAILGWLANALQFAQMSAGIAAACGGFLCMNFPPAKIFMGDLGSASLGFLAAVLMLWASHYNIFPLWVGIIVFSPFIVDATWTLVSRVIRGERFWRAHQEHFYQRLARLGWGQQRIVLSEYALMLVCGLLAIILNMINWSLIQIFGLGFVLLAFLGLGLLINNSKAYRKEEKSRC